MAEKTITLSPVFDSQFTSSQANTDLSTKTTMDMAGNWTTTLSVIGLQFNLPAELKNSTIKAANLTLRKYGGATGRPITICVGNAPFNSSINTWNKLNSSGADVTNYNALGLISIKSDTPTSNGQDMSLNVLPLIKYMAEQDKLTNGLFMKFNNGDLTSTYTTYTFCSSEYATSTNRPALTLIYEPQEVETPDIINDLPENFIYQTLIQYDKDTNQLYRVTTANESSSISTQLESPYTDYSLKMDTEGNIYFATSKGLSKYSRAGDLLWHDATISVYDIKIGKNNQVYVESLPFGSSVKRIDPDTKQVLWAQSNLRHVVPNLTLGRLFGFTQSDEFVEVDSESGGIIQTFGTLPQRPRNNVIVDDDLSVYSWTNFTGSGYSAGLFKWTSGSTHDWQIPSNMEMQFRVLADKLIALEAVNTRIGSNNTMIYTLKHLSKLHGATLSSYAIDQPSETMATYSGLLEVGASNTVWVYYAQEPVGLNRKGRLLHLDQETFDVYLDGKAPTNVSKIALQPIEVVPPSMHVEIPSPTSEGQIQEELPEIQTERFVTITSDFAQAEIESPLSSVSLDSNAEIAISLIEMTFASDEPNIVASQSTMILSDIDSVNMSIYAPTLSVHQNTRFEVEPSDMSLIAESASIEITQEMVVDVENLHIQYVMLYPTVKSEANAIINIPVASQEADTSVPDIQTGFGIQLSVEQAEGYLEAFPAEVTLRIDNSETIPSLAFEISPYIPNVQTSSHATIEPLPSHGQLEGNVVHIRIDTSAHIEVEPIDNITLNMLVPDISTGYGMVIISESATLKAEALPPTLENQREIAIQVEEVADSTIEGCLPIIYQEGSITIGIPIIDLFAESLEARVSIKPTIQTPIGLSLRTGDLLNLTIDNQTLTLKIIENNPFTGTVK